MKEQLALERVEEQRSMNPLEMVQSAIEKGIAPESLKQIMDLAERFQANQARMAFYAAMKRFKDIPVQIRKNGTGHNNAKYATLDHACDQIIPALASVGITHKWKTVVADGKISVTCILTHELGFSDPDPSTIEVAPDTSGSKNPIQAVGSAIKYLERYTLFAATGLDDGSKDDDGAGSGPKAPQPELLERIDWIKNCNTLPELQKVFAASYTWAKEIGDGDAQKQLIATKDARKRELA